MPLYAIDCEVPLPPALADGTDVRGYGSSHMTRDGSCFDESFFEPNEIEKVMPYVETVEDEGEEDRIRVFVHFDDGDMYEIKLKKIDEDCKQNRFFDDFCELRGKHNEY